MITKTLMVWNGEEETDATHGATIMFQANKLAKNGKTYVLKDIRGEIVATIKIAKHAHSREIADARF